MEASEVLLGHCVVHKQSLQVEAHLLLVLLVLSVPAVKAQNNSTQPAVHQNLGQLLTTNKCHGALMSCLPQLQNGM